ncbi:Tof2p KNAG_0C01630 [Huiozyma naganishii CBS 8797]|uniref:Nucleolar protein Dnt1-like N-terminal domain-containing protein n=1 Tax=Huiozyma naganishii (strain ATCC MYA-139 / BCRC 22969 / CBS 8797 / KCTC 17520 / NBRC 10181 / NCYC 3082 / Yp74L-3) TaxID=1071383 RepID=J7RWA4_HUIN7|nr:hypothetical protein KNAG_0C01630 [Kazachstania naganishii CBS 8797]CCK69277.1 hypothetical protein KNAG_0C01630 [Kazachstania naganishii CBS 8797]
MYKVQVVLVPPSVRDSFAPPNLASALEDSSHLLNNGMVAGLPAQASGNLQQTNPEVSALYQNWTNNSFMMSSFLTQPKMKRFLHFTKSNNTLLDLSQEILDKCEKMYPNLTEDIEILSLQDSNACDLDPDFVVKDVFSMDNTVRVILKDELGETNEPAPVSVYASVKRRKLNDGNQQLAPATAPQASGSLKVAKKRSQSSTIKGPPNPGLRISTPLANQIYPNTVTNNSDDEEEVGERSFLPPPTQPQSPPIRISSGIENYKKVKHSTDVDTVSRSETVDPDKSRQQRILSETPLRTAMTPNRVTLTGQRVVSENNNGPSNGLIFTSTTTSQHQVNTASSPRITSGMLTIPEPKIAEVEEELKEGPSSPSSLLPSKADRIPMKKPYIEDPAGVDLDGSISSSSSSSSSTHSEPASKQLKIHKPESLQVGETSANEIGEGSPIKNSPFNNIRPNQVHRELANSKQKETNAPPIVKNGATKINGHPSAPVRNRDSERKSSLEAKVENKSFSQKSLRRINSFPEDDEESSGKRSRLGETDEPISTTEDAESSSGADGEDTVRYTDIKSDLHNNSHEPILKGDLLNIVDKEVAKEGKVSPVTNAKTAILEKPHIRINNSKTDGKEALGTEINPNGKNIIINENEQKKVLNIKELKSELVDKNSGAKTGKPVQENTKPEERSKSISAGVQPLASSTQPSIVSQQQGHTPTLTHPPANIGSVKSKPLPLKKVVIDKGNSASSKSSSEEDSSTEDNSSSDLSDDTEEKTPRLSARKVTIKAVLEPRTDDRDSVKSANSTNANLPVSEKKGQSISVLHETEDSDFSSEEASSSDDERVARVKKVTMKANPKKQVQEIVEKSKPPIQKYVPPKKNQKVYLSADYIDTTDEESSEDEGDDKADEQTKKLVEAKTANKNNVFKVDHNPQNGTGVEAADSKKKTKSNPVKKTVNQNMEKPNAAEDASHKKKEESKVFQKTDQKALKETVEKANNTGNVVSVQKKEPSQNVANSTVKSNMPNKKDLSKLLAPKNVQTKPAESKPLPGTELDRKGSKMAGPSSFPVKEPSKPAPLGPVVEREAESKISTDVLNENVKKDAISSKSQKPVEPVSKPITGTVSKPASTPASKPITGTVSKPASTPASKPVSTPISKPVPSPKPKDSKIDSDEYYSTSSSSNDDNDSSSGSDSSSDGDSSQGEEDVSSSARLLKRKIVSPPRGVVNSSQKELPSVNLDSITEVPQSTQQPAPSSQEAKRPPLRKQSLDKQDTQLPSSQPPSSGAKKTTTKSALSSLPQKYRPSLSSLSDLVSRGIPEVKEKNSKAGKSSLVNKTKQIISEDKSSSDYSSSSDDSSSGDDSESDSGSDSGSNSGSDSDADSDSSDSSDDDKSKFISAKSAGAALKKKKANKISGGFASLVRDSKRKT